MSAAPAVARRWRPVPSRAGVVRAVATVVPTALALVLWEVASARGWVNGFLASSPTRVVEAARQWADSGLLLEDLRATSVLLLVAMLAAAVSGLGVGLLTARSSVARELLDPLLWFGYNVPLVAFIPLLMLWFGLGAPTAVVLGALLGFFPMYANTVAGVRSVDPVYYRLARSLRRRPWSVMTSITLPASVPYLLAGLRLAFGRVFVGVTAGEVFAGRSMGIGYRLRNSSDLLRIDAAFAAVVVIALMAVLAGTALRALEDRLDRWRLSQGASFERTG